ncbi:MAG: glutamine synthetase family protein [Gaiellaceae bacterium]
METMTEWGAGPAGSPQERGMLTLEELREEVERGAIDTVVAAFTDMQGRLIGKREHAAFFLAETAEHGLEGCNYLMALDMDMDPQPGYAMASWERGYGDFVMRPDLATLRRLPWLEGTALVLCDVVWEDGSPVVASPRQVLAAQVERARALGLEPMIGSELEFYLFKESYAEAHAKHFRGLTPSVPYILDYHILATTFDEPLIRQIRNGMVGAGIPVESSKGEAWPGQQEINFRFTDALGMADNHTIYKNGAKEIAHANGCSITFMAKPDHEWIGNSCHIHSSLWRDGENAFGGESRLFNGYLAGQIACAREMALFFAPNINSYKRYAAATWAPTTIAWGRDNRTCAYRVVGHGRSLRAETRLPGGDVNPYLAFAALIASGLHGIEQELELPPAHEGNAYESGVEKFPSSLREAIDELERGTVARRAFGDEVVDHYLNYGRNEQRIFDSVVTCWERERLFERG